MEIEITKDEKNKLLKRKQVRFTVSFDGPTPSRQEVRALLCKKLHAKEELTVIDRLAQGFGSTVLDGYAKVYDDPEALKMELEYKIKRSEPKKAEEGAGETKKEKPKEAAPAKAEEKKEEAKK